MRSKPSQTDVGSPLGGPSCPECGTPIHWLRRWVRGTVWDHWPCAHCGRLLRISHRRQIGFVVLAGLVIIMTQTMPHLRLLPAGPPWASRAILIGVLAATALSFPFLERIELAIEADPGLCNSCGYDLRVQKETGRPHCPECGQAIEER